MSWLSDGLPVSTIVSYVYVEQFEYLALSTYSYTGLQSWYSYVFVVLHCDENDKFCHHINVVDPNIKLTQVYISDERLSYLGLFGDYLH